MHPVTHLLTSWTIAESASLSPRDRLIVTLSGVVPDVDGLGLIAEIATERSESPLYWWSEYHHVLCHNIGFAMVVALVAAFGASRRACTALLTACVFHVHLLADVMGSRGPDGHQWPIPYLLPFSRRWQWTWDGQWELNAWPNVTLTVALLVIALYLAWKRGYSPVGIVSARADAAVVAALRKRFGEPRSLV